MGFGLLSFRVWMDSAGGFDAKDEATYGFD